ncbi:MAG TPA: hypothetical protein VLJ37_01970 [bacterium]|nr:hypothetical protein [bacterium]
MNPLFLIFLVLVPSLSWAASGEPDATFGGGDGIVQTPFAVSSFAADLEIQKDGKIVVVGTADEGTGSDFAVIRYHADGSLDDTFGTGGIVLTPVVPNESDAARALDIQEDGSLIVAGKSSFNDFVVVRYSSAGVLDPNFGQGGVFRLPGADISDSLGGMAVQPDGKIILGGVRNQAIAALRLLADGSSLDPDFGTGGIATASLGGDGGEGRAMALQPDGKVLVAGRNFTDQDTVVVRFDGEGSQEMGFGGVGFAQQSLVPGIDWAEAVALQDDGKIVAACLTSGVTNDMGVVRFNGDGTPDPGFSGDGFLVEPLASGQDIANGLAFQADGRILVVGSAYEGMEGAFGVMRLNPDGSLDGSFSGDGKNRVVAGADAEARAVAVTSDGRILMAGVAGDQITLVRLEGDSADLSATLGADPAGVETGDPVTLTAVIANGAGIPVGGVTLAASIPSGLTVEGTTPPCTGTSELECPLGLLAAGGAATVTIEVRANAAGTFSPQVSVSGQAVDPNSGNNTASVSITVTEPGPGPGPEPGSPTSSSGGCSLVF